VPAVLAMAAAPTTRPAPPAPAADREGVVQCANLTYARTKSSVCFSDKFLRQVASETSIRTEDHFRPVRLDADELYNHPFAIMTGEGKFELTDAERKNLKSYLERGGFLLASAGCSSPDWNRAFRDELKRIFPERKLKKLEMSHPVFHTVYDIDQIKMKKPTTVKLEGLEIDGKLVLIYSEQGLNDTANAGKGCCCCGGNEIANAQYMNVNILTYALTH
jgi:hypothetical protein